MDFNQNDDLQMLAFIGYDKLRKTNLLNYKNPEIAKELIRHYYSGEIIRINFDGINEIFNEKYFKNENNIEGVKDIREIEGLSMMYKKMIETPIDEMEIFYLPILHRILFSKMETGFGGKIRNSSAFINGSPIDLSAPELIYSNLLDLEDKYNELKEKAKNMRINDNYVEIFNFIREVIRLKCRLIYIHPFSDGNGRTIRCFINKLFLEAGIPPVYVRESEKDIYKEALDDALRYRSAGEINDDSKYDYINSFYLHKICDSIIQLDMTERFVGKTVKILKKIN